MTEEQVFLAALDLPDPADRAAYLDRACGGDGGLRRQVDDLLALHFKPGEFLDEPFGKPTGAAPPADPGDAGEAGGLPFLQPSARPGSLGRIGHYEVLEVLGRGGFGIVVRAFDEVLQRVAALKVLAPAIAATSPARKRFLREARASAKVRHENVVQVYSVEEQPVPYLVMEYIPGETLQQRLDRTGPLDVSEVVRLGRQIAEGLAAAHATGLIHRDVKPGNVLIEAGGQERVKLTDFGLARAADDASHTQSGVLAGTPMYMAPEQARGEGLDHRADLFSLGSVMYVMAAGRAPFRAATTYAVLKRVVEDDPRPIRELIPETPPWLCDVIARLQAKKPEDRFGSAREAADVLAICEARLRGNAGLPDFPRSRPAATAGGPGRRKWIVAAAALVLPVLALAMTEAAGVTHWLRERLPASGAENGDGDRAGAEDGGLPAYTNTLGMKFRLVPAGRFPMGSPKAEIDRCLKLVGDGWENDRLPTEGPEHLVEITQPFYMGATEVTLGQFRRFIDDAGYRMGDARWKYPGFEQTDDHPVVFVSWQNAVDFCSWLGEKEGKKYRLPTEAEWEYSCRAGGAGTRYCWGDDEARLEHYAWYGANAPGGTEPAGRKKPNDWGLYDMHGNVWEWCADFYDPNYYKDGPVKDPRGGAGGERVLRGGSWNNSPVDCRSAFRNHTYPGQRADNDGFRVVLVAPPAAVRPEGGK